MWAPTRRIEKTTASRGRSPGQDRCVFLGLEAERRPRIVDQGSEDATQQIALRDDHVGAVLDHSRIKLALGHEWRAELIEIAVKPPMAPRPDVMHRSVPVPTAIEAGGVPPGGGKTNIVPLSRPTERQC